MTLQGAKNIKKKYHFLGKNIVTIFLRPENTQVLVDRLIHRGDDGEEINRRIHSAQYELKCAKNYDYEIISGTKEEDYLSIKNIFDYETQESQQKSTLYFSYNAHEMTKKYAL